MSGFFQLCKESYGGLACVQSNRCLSQCKDSQLCTEDHKCRAPHNCKVDRDCKYREECKEDTFGRRTCQLPRITTSTIIQILLTNNECGSVKDCRLLNPNKPVCKEEYGSNTCHLDDTKVCRKFIPGGSKTCVGYTIGEQSLPCFTNKGCQGGGNGKTVCKESQGKRTCVHPDQCLSKCFSQLGYCDSEHRCKLTCITAWDCKSDQVCKSLGTHGEKICQSEPTSSQHVEICEKNLDCKKTGGNNTVCKGAKLEKALFFLNHLFEQNLSLVFFYILQCKILWASQSDETTPL